MGTLTVALQDQLRYTIGPPLADEIRRKLLGKGKAALVFARDVLEAGGGELTQNPRYRNLVEDLEPDRPNDGLKVDVEWKR